jgi:chloramphenicol O-acetyltransferase
MAYLSGVVLYDFHIIKKIKEGRVFFPISVTVQHSMTPDCHISEFRSATVMLLIMENKK